MSKASTMDSFSRNAVENFVQTVVFVDDKIYAPSPKGTVIEEKKVSAPKVRKPATKSVAKKPIDLAVYDNEKLEETATFSPHDIQASFAKKRIVCSLHQPIKRKSVGIESDTYKLCASADIVIVDWDLYGDAGENAKTLIENLVLQSLEEDPHQLRLVLIYTDNPNLFDISDRVSERLIAKIPKGIEYKDADKGLAFHTLNARVVVLGKPAIRLDEFKPFEVRESELADRAIAEFCKLTNGMLQGGILMGLATIRKQSRKILTKFHSGLDAAFLTHRALSLPHEEAFDHITPLLVAEIEAVLEDSLPTPLIDNSKIENWCKEKWIPSGHAKQFISEGIDIHEFAKDFCIKGMAIADNYTPGNISDLAKTIKTLKEKTPKWPSVDAPSFKMLTSYLSKDSSGSDLRELSVLMSQRTYYGDGRHLTLGTIIRESGGDKRYLICLQPTCDSVRLTKVSTFLFCLLSVAKGEKTTHIVGNGKDFTDLIFKPEIENCVTLTFKPSKGLVTANKLEFTDHSVGQGYQWIAQLKPKHAQRAAEQFARELSRVGLTESEWLRLKTK
ncbi:hypothetical protein OR1_00661 [Geobacter sp. OR-1]|uniref:response regulator receiver domain n=1 Tax=Geobacter sp. OR-1 TaxID=1266765 RepID=UPI0005423066|nr:response regulator receiver domain [Geobacter sp. OR-1]GAM08390.1 hypothetical protein OR1_00661 [Geobacter sp. OR-1]